MTDQFEDFTAKAPTLVFDEAPKAPEQKPEPEKEKRWNESLLSPEEKQQADAEKAPYYFLHPHFHGLTSNGIFNNI